jgi:hypothetical protein
MKTVTLKHIPPNPRFYSKILSRGINRIVSHLVLVPMKHACGKSGCKCTRGELHESPYVALGPLQGSLKRFGTRTGRHLLKTGLLFSRNAVIPSLAASVHAISAVPRYPISSASKKVSAAAPSLMV